MGMPKSVTKVKTDHVEYVSNVDAVNYTINELSRAALRDVGKFLRKRMKQVVAVKSGATKKNIGTWVRKSEDGTPRLQIGVYDRTRSKKKGNPYAFWAFLLEFGSSKMDAQPFIKPTVFNNIDEIRKIEAQYLSAISGEVRDNFDESEEIRDD